MTVGFSNVEAPFSRYALQNKRMIFTCGISKSLYSRCNEFYIFEITHDIFRYYIIFIPFFHNYFMNGRILCVYRFYSGQHSSKQ